MSEERKDHADNNNISTTDPDFSWLSEPLVHGAVDMMYKVMKGPFKDENLNITDFAEWMEKESNLPELWDIGNRPLPTYNADQVPVRKNTQNRISILLSHLEQNTKCHVPFSKRTDCSVTYKPSQSCICPLVSIILLYHLH
mmetsp:Transcript_37633/g.49581  ORF Transcript_37633/g.49581 Transcript_37633/m.49581 type:complete len:141 (-) Transcript_37633:2544-2966(-)